MITLNNYNIKDMRNNGVESPVAYMIKDLLNFRQINITNDIDYNDEQELDEIWSQIKEVRSGEDLMNWAKQMRYFIWGSEKEWEECTHEWEQDEQFNYLNRLFFLLGTNVAEIISNKDYWENEWSKAKTSNYLKLEMNEIANKNYVNFYNDEKDNEYEIEDVIEKAIEVKEKYSLLSISCAGYLPFNSIMDFLNKLDDSLMNLADVLAWDYEDIGADRISFTYGLDRDVKNKAHYNDFTRNININVGAGGYLAHEFAHALDNAIGDYTFNARNKYKRNFISEDSTNQIVGLNDEYILLRQTINKHFIRKYKMFEINEIQLKILDSVESLFNNILKGLDKNKLLKAFIENRKSDFKIIINKIKILDSKKEENDKLWNIWKNNTLKMMESDDISEILNENHHIKNQIIVLIKLIDDIFSKNIKINKQSWIIISEYLEKELFELEKENGIISEYATLDPYYGSFKEIWARSFHAFVAGQSGIDSWLAKDVSEDIYHPNGDDLDIEFSWWVENIPNFYEYWIS